MDKAGRWFYDYEFACKCGCGTNNISPALVCMLDKIRDMRNEAIYITSGCRCTGHNRQVGGKTDSAHLSGLAVDVAIKNSNERYELLAFAIMQGFQRIGIGTDFIHLDIDEEKPQDVAWSY